MSELIGAWSLDGGAPVLPDDLRAAMLAAAGPGARVRARGRLWLACAELTEDGGRAAAAAGLVAGDPAAELRRWLASGGAPSFEGHYAAARADGDTLELWRDPTGGERLFWTRLPGLLLFSSSVKALWSHPAVPRGVEPEAVFELALTDIVHFGDLTAYAGIRGVPAGRGLRVEGAAFRSLRGWDEAFVPLEGAPEALAPRYREALNEAVSRTIAGRGRAAVMLSGGIDSSAIAVAACEAVGAANVEAFTYEYAHPSHKTESGYAAAVCRKLGLRKHHVLALSREDYRQSVLDSLWLGESAAEWMKADAAFMSRRIAREGFDRSLTGGGIGSHLAYVEGLCALFERLPALDLLFRFWTRPGPGAAWLHPGLERLAGMNNGRLTLSVYGALRHAGLLSGPRPLAPELARPLAEAVASSARAKEELDGLRDLPLAARLQRLLLAHGNSAVDVTRTEPACRRAGAARVSPAFFPSCAAFSHLPFRARRSGLRPGKELLRLAYGKDLPEEVLRRRKDWTQTWAPYDWVWRPKSSEDVLKLLSAAPGGLPRLMPWLMPWRGGHLRHHALWSELLLSRRLEAPRLRDLEPA